MPSVNVVYYRDDDGTVPALEFVTKMPEKAKVKLAIRIKRLVQLGHELRRPECDYLRDGIYELRVRLGHVNYRVLYFFHGRTIAVLGGGLTKESEIPSAVIERVLKRKAGFEQS